MYNSVVLIWSVLLFTDFVFIFCDFYSWCCFCNRVPTYPYYSIPRLEDFYSSLQYQLTTLTTSIVPFRYLVVTSQVSSLPPLTAFSPQVSIPPKLFAFISVYYISVCTNSFSYFCFSSFVRRCKHRLHLHCFLFVASSFIDQAISVNMFIQLLR